MENDEFETFKPFGLLFRISMCVFFKTHTIESRCVTGPENILFSGASMHFFWPGILQAGAVKGLN